MPPGQERLDAGPPEVAVTGDDERAVRPRELAAQARQLDGRTVGQPGREVDSHQVDRATVDVELDVQPTPFGGRVGRNRADRELAPQLRGKPTDDREADGAVAAAVARHVRPRFHPGAAERQLEHLRAELVADRASHGGAVVGRPRLLDDDHVGVEAAQHGGEVVGLADPVAAGLETGVAVEADDGEVGMREREGSGVRRGAQVSGKRTRMRVPPMAASSIDTVPPCCSTVAFTMARPRPETASVAGPTVVEAGEALEHALAILDGDAGAVVVDGELDARRRRCATRPGPWCRRARAALSMQVAHDSAELIAATVHATRRHPGRVDRDAVLVDGLVEHQLVEVDFGQRLERAWSPRSRRVGPARAAR